MTSARLGQMRRRAMLRQSKCQEKDTKLCKNGKCQYVNKMANIPCDGYNKSEIDARTEERGRSWKWFVGVVENSPGPSWQSLGITPRPSRRLKLASVWIRARPLESLALPGTSLVAWTLVKRSPLHLFPSSPPSPTQTFFCLWCASLSGQNRTCLSKEAREAREGACQTFVMICLRFRGGVG